MLATKNLDYRLALDPSGHILQAHRLRDVSQDVQDGTVLFTQHSPHMHRLVHDGNPIQDSELSGPYMCLLIAQL